MEGESLFVSIISFNKASFLSFVFTNFETKAMRSLKGKSEIIFDEYVSGLSKCASFAHSIKRLFY